MSRNVAHLLLTNELGSGSGRCARARGRNDIKRSLAQWQESDSLEHCVADYAEFQPAPRSTIALCYNCNGELLASTHGDHTVKIVSCRTGKLVRVLTGHRRTPWVVRFHPSKPNILASGSLDHEVRLWDASTGECFAHHTFGKPIASLAFHMNSDVLAIACGHKLYMWEYPSPDRAEQGAGRGPVIVLKTRRSMRAVHFHPHGLPLVLTAEVQDASATPQLPETLTENGSYQQNTARNNSSKTSPTTPIKQQTVRPDAPAKRKIVSSFSPSNKTSPSQRNTTQADQELNEADVVFGNDAMASPSVPVAPVPPVATAADRIPPLPPSMVDIGYEFPFPLHAHAQNPTAAVGPAGGVAMDMGGLQPPWATQAQAAGTWNPQLMAAFSAAAWNIIGDEQPPRVRLRLWNFNAAKPTALFESNTGVRLQLSDAVLCSEMGVHFSPCGRYIAATVACRAPFEPPGGAQWAAAATSGLLNRAYSAPGRSHVPEILVPATTTSSAVPLQQQGQEMLAPSWSAPPLPAPVLPLATDQLASTPSAELLASAAELSPYAAANLLASPAPERVVYEVRIISIDGDTFGQVSRAKRIRAAHCLTSVQFSPNSDHLLLAYGKKHVSLLRSLVPDRGRMVALHTILEVLRLSDMDVATVLPSSEDEINAACFHPSPGGGIAYGTKEGRLRVVSHQNNDTDDAYTTSDNNNGPVAMDTTPIFPASATQQEYLFMQSMMQQQQAPPVDDGNNSMQQ